MTRCYSVFIFVTLCTLSSRALAQDSDAAFEGLLDALQASRALIVSETAEEGTDRAEGLRHLVRLVEMQNARATDDHDAAHPHVSRCPSLVCKVGFDNPDFTYINVGPISPEYNYRVFGKRGTVPYLSMQVFDNPLGGTEFMTSEELVVQPDGRYEIILSAEEPEGAANWMRLKDTAFFFILRNGFYDWNAEVEASVQVEVVAGPMSGPVPHLTPAEFAGDMARLSTRIRSIPISILNARDTWPTNDLNEPDPGAFGIEGAGIPTAVSSAGRYDLDSDEAMIIETPVPDVIHGGIQLGNLWVESIDYQTRQTSLNWFQSIPDSDGVIRYVLAHEDPGVPNWLDVSGHPRGTIFMRWQSPSAESYPLKPNVSVVRFDQIRDRLPADHPTVTVDERQRVLEERYLAVNKRRNPTAQFDEVQSSSSSDGGGGCAVERAPDEGAPLWVFVGILLAISRRCRNARSRCTR